MAITNHDRVGKALELLTSGLKPFVERELKSSWGDKFVENTKLLLSDTRLQARAADGSPLLNVSALLVIRDREWKGIFSQTLGKAERSMVNEGARGAEQVGAPATIQHGRRVSRARQREPVAGFDLRAHRGG